MRQIAIMARRGNGPGAGHSLTLIYHNCNERAAVGQHRYRPCRRPPGVGKGLGNGNGKVG